VYMPTTIQPARRLDTRQLVARICSVPILLLSFLMIFGHIIFPDTEAGTYPPIENLLPALMSLSVLGLGIAWWRPRIGGAFTILFFFAHLIAYWAIRGQFFPLNVLVLFSPVFIAGVLFMVSGRPKWQDG
ncbi:MAG: hypothetical protein P1S60_17575, partial [Anaerolineae bacterium]|nr:hypothetical protein [Anaerolineae bacterium]